jgi:hypothetical protein
MSDRKLRLFSCAGCRRILHMMRDARSRQAVEVAERYADGLASLQELQAVETAAREAADAAEAERAVGWNAARTAAAAAGQQARAGAERAACTAADADLFRHHFGNPFRPVLLDPAWLAWNGGTVVQLAQAIYEERHFGDLVVLADALEEAGCTHEEILNHCREPASHYRGCWVLDLLLGKE